MSDRAVRERLEPIPRVTLGMEEAAASLGVSRDFFDQHIAHELRTVRRGRKRLVAVDELQRWARSSAAKWDA